MSELTGPQIADQLPAGWRNVARAIRVRYTTEDFATGLAFVDRVGAAAEAAHHHPDIDLRYGSVAISLRSHDVDAITSRDLALAHTIDGLAGEAGLVAHPGAAAQMTVCIDTTDASRLRPFWAAAAGLDPAGAPDGGAADEPGDEADDEPAIVDPTGQLPVVWFQHTDQPRTDRNRIHLDIYVPDDVATDRVAAMVAAGGTLVTDRFAPAWWVVADADGNECCICTWRDPAA